MKPRVRIKLEGGVVQVAYLPEGIELEVIDYDVEGENPDEVDLFDGEPCRHWVEGADGAAKDCEYDSDESWQHWLAGNVEPTGKGGEDA